MGSSLTPRRPHIDFSEADPNWLPAAPRFAHRQNGGSLLLPYLAGRPVNMHRYPEGVERQGFWQQELPAGAPEWVTRWHDPEAGPDDADCRVVADHVATLVWLANLAALELHPWTGRLPEPRRPTWALIDVDPGTRTTFAQVLVLARLFRTALQHLGVAGMPKVTGQRGRDPEGATVGRRLVGILEEGLAAEQAAAQRSPQATRGARFQIDAVRHADH